jgi:ComF family protein
MTTGKDAWRERLQRVQHFVLPLRCLLCGDVGDAEIDLCADCAAELPRNRHCCRRCALPLATPTALCGECQRRTPPWDAAWAPFRYGWPLDRLESRFKFGADLAAGHVLARLWQRESCPLPLPQRLNTVHLNQGRLPLRGYNQALELARPLARELNVPLHHDVLRRRRRTAAQTELDAPARRHNVRDAFSLRPNVQMPDHVAILDDVMTTGATLAECARLLKRDGVQRVDVWALARAPRPRSI